jgi:hypothetical protein
MAGQMNRIENAARLAMADLGTEIAIPVVPSGSSLAVRFGLLVASLCADG